jgi:site-specific recombinase XerD
MAVGNGERAAGLRQRALFAVLYFGGLRIAEALELRPRDLDLGCGAVNVRGGKGGKQRMAAAKLARCRPELRCG